MPADNAVQERMKQAQEKWKSFKASAKAPAAKRGQAFEEIVTAFFESIPGFEVQARAQESDHVDLVLWNEGTDPIGQELDRVIMVDCKAGREPAGPESVRQMDQVLMYRALKTGVVVSASGFTPDAVQQARGAFYHNRRKILLLDGRDFRGVGSVEDARKILKRSYTDLYRT
jgi:hypothetical protein